MSTKKKNANPNSPTFGWDFWKFFIPFLILMVSIMFFPLWFTQKDWFSNFNLITSDKTGQMGDTFGGLMGPFVAMVAAGLTFIAFWVQYKANEQQRNDIRLERFENKFYELLRIHKDNVRELEIDGHYTGRVAFVKMYDEFRFIYQYLEYILTDRHEVSTSDLEKLKCWMTKVAYNHFFLGVHNDTNPITKNETKMKWEEELLQGLKSIKNGFIYHKDNMLMIDMNIKDRPWETLLGVKNELKIDFMPFEGHLYKLGHYYRHLYQTFKMAATDPVLLRDNPEDEFKLRYQYIKLVRVQLSNHEQAMIYYNSFISSGKIWWEDKDFRNPYGGKLSYFLDYRIIKNIPFYLTDNLGVKPRDKFIAALKERERTEEEIERELIELFEGIGG